MKVTRSAFSCLWGWLALCAICAPLYQVQASEHTFISSPFSKSYENLLQQKAENSRISLMWDMKSRAESYSSAIDNAFFFAFTGSGHLKYRLLDRLHLDLKAVVLLQGGQAQSRFNELLPSGPAFLSHGFFNYDVLGNETLELKAGALSQSKVFNSSVFISRRAFPGIEESLKLKVNDFCFKASAQQVIPTTYTFSTALIEREKTPSLNTGNLSACYENDKVHLTLRGGVFDFSNLPGYVADISRLYGNTVDGPGYNARFKYGFRGWHAGFDAYYNPNKDVSFRLATTMLENMGAIPTTNQAQHIEVSGHYRFNHAFGFDLSFNNFFVESDAVPAFFMSRFAQANSKGYGIEFGTQWIEKKVRVGVAYTFVDLINPDESKRQLSNDILSINLETAHELFN